MVNKPKNLGTSAESMVRDYARTLYWPYARRMELNGKNDIGDINLHPKIMVEVKYASGRLNIGPWMRETDVQQMRKGADYGVLVIKPPGIGAKNVGKFLVCMRAGLMMKLLWDTDTRRMAEVPIFDHRLRVVEKLLEMEAAQNEVGNMYNVVTFRVVGEPDPDLFYSFMRLGPFLDLLNLAGYGAYLDVEARIESNDPGDIV